MSKLRQDGWSRQVGRVAEMEGEWQEAEAYVWENGLGRGLQFPCSDLLVVHSCPYPVSRASLSHHRHSLHLHLDPLVLPP